VRNKKNTQERTGSFKSRRTGPALGREAASWLNQISNWKWDPNQAYIPIADNQGEGTFLGPLRRPAVGAWPRMTKKPEGKAET